MISQISKKERFCYIFTICGLLILIGLILFLSLSGILFSTVATKVTDVPLGSTSIISLKQNDVGYASFTMNGSIVSGEKIPQKINIKNEGEGDVFLRVKSSVFTADKGGIFMPLLITNSFVLIGDYYYFTSPLASFATCGLCSGIIVKEDYSFSNKNQYVVTVIAESLGVDEDVEKIWGVEKTIFE